MIFVVYGTTAEYVKLMPLILELEKRRAGLTIALAQHEEQLRDLFHAYPDLPGPDLWLVHGFRGRDLSAFSQIPIWFGKAVVDIARSWKTVRRAAGAVRSKNVWLVHGDTFTAVAGAAWGRLMGYPVGHVEAGLRSRSLAHPFPEELNRSVVTRLARIHFAPGAGAVRNLATARGEIVDTGANTSHDAIRYARHRAAASAPDLPGRFGIVSLHRTELVGNRRLLVRTLRTIARCGAEVPLVFIDHPVTVAAVCRAGLDDLLGESLIRVPKLDYFRFIGLLGRSSFVITDSGGLQEDCAYLGKPCLLIRKTTERADGIAEGIVRLSHYDDGVLRDFLHRPEAGPVHAQAPTERPTDTVVEYLVRRGLIPGAPIPEVRTAGITTVREPVKEQALSPGDTAAG